MDEISILFAKIAALQKNLKGITWYSGRTGGIILEPLLRQYEYLISKGKEILPELFLDMPEVQIPKPYSSSVSTGNIYTLRDATPVILSVDYILEVRSSYRVGENIENKERSKRVFISHGRSKEWYKVQAFIEKDIKLQTLELAQEPILGRTILQKLNEEAGRCGYAVIVMTGEDMVDEEVRARENVMHEIGFFQGKYGLQNITLLKDWFIFHFQKIQLKRLLVP